MRGNSKFLESCCEHHHFLHCLCFSQTNIDINGPNAHCVKITQNSLICTSYNIASEASYVYLNYCAKNFR